MRFVGCNSTVPRCLTDDVNQSGGDSMLVVARNCVFKSNCLSASDICDCLHENILFEFIFTNSVRTVYMLAHLKINLCRHKFR